MLDRTSTRYYPLGSWDRYFAVQQQIVDPNQQIRHHANRRTEKWPPFVPVSWTSTGPSPGLDLDPCGRIVDVARFCYTAPFRFFNDSPVTYPVQWYRAEQTAEFMPFFHAFGNSLYYTIEENQLGQLGEQPEQRTWNAGARIQTARGRHFCGTRTEWRDGLTYDPVAPPVTRRGDGLLTCCGMAPPSRLFHRPGSPRRDGLSIRR